MIKSSSIQHQLLNSKSPINISNQDALSLKKSLSILSIANSVLNITTMHRNKNLKNPTSNVSTNKLQEYNKTQNIYKNFLNNNFIVPYVNNKETSSSKMSKNKRKINTFGLSNSNSSKISNPINNVKVNQIKCFNANNTIDTETLNIKKNFNLNSANKSLLNRQTIMKKGNVLSQLKKQNIKLVNDCFYDNNKNDESLTNKGSITVKKKTTKDINSNILSNKINKTKNDKILLKEYLSLNNNEKNKQNTSKSYERNGTSSIDTKNKSYNLNVSKDISKEKNKKVNKKNINLKNDNKSVIGVSGKVIKDKDKINCYDHIESNNRKIIKSNFKKSTSTYYLKNNKYDNSILKDKINSSLNKKYDYFHYNFNKLNFENQVKTNTNNDTSKIKSNLNKSLINHNNNNNITKIVTRQQMNSQNYMNTDIFKKNQSINKINIKNSSFGINGIINNNINLSNLNTSNNNELKFTKNNVSCINIKRQKDKSLDKINQVNLNVIQTPKYITQYNNKKHIHIERKPKNNYINIKNTKVFDSFNTINICESTKNSSSKNKLFYNFSTNIKDNKVLDTINESFKNNNKDLNEKLYYNNLIKYDSNERSYISCINLYSTKIFDELRIREINENKKIPTKRNSENLRKVNYSSLLNSKNKMPPQKMNIQKRNLDLSKNKNTQSTLNFNNRIKNTIIENPYDKSDKIFSTIPANIASPIENCESLADKSKVSVSNNTNTCITTNTNINTSSSLSVNLLFTGKLKDYRIIKEIGKGSFGRVKLAIHKKTKLKVAIKIYEKYSIFNKQKKSIVQNEIKILKQMSNEYIVKLYEVIETEKKLYLVLELIEGMSLLEYLKLHKNNKLSEEYCKRLYKQIIEGINYCHSHNICHRDIKLENILITENNRKIKIIDFGFGLKLNEDDQKQKLFCGTPAYMSPEIVMKQPYDPFKSDIWSLGILLYIMICGCFPFTSEGDKELYQKIQGGEYVIPNFISGRAKQIIRRILKMDPEERPKAGEILKDPWFIKSDY